MRNRLIRIILFAAVVFLLAMIFQFFILNFSGEGYKTAEEALPTDANYEWIEGPKSDKEHRYFFLSNSKYFGTGVVTKNFKGWSSGQGAYAPLPKPLKENEITSAFSGGEIIFGLIKRNGEVEVTVNGEKTSFIELAIEKEVMELYQVEGYSIWYVDLDKMEDTEHFHIQVMNHSGEVISELSI